MDIRNVIQSQLERVVAEHSPMPFPENIEDDDELDLFGQRGPTRHHLLYSLGKALVNVQQLLVQVGFE